MCEGRHNASVSINNHNHNKKNHHLLEIVVYSYNLEYIIVNYKINDAHSIRLQIKIHRIQ